LGRRGSELGQRGPLARAGEKEAGGLSWLRGPRKRKEEKENGPGKWAKGETERGEEKRILFLKLFSISFFKLSNFTQTRNHAFES
jgi:hypothetical protein